MTQAQATAEKPVTSVQIRFSATLTTSPDLCPPRGAGETTYFNFIKRTLNPDGKSRLDCDGLHIVTESRAQQPSKDDLLTYEHEAFTADGERLERSFAIEETVPSAGRPSQYALRVKEGSQSSAPTLVAIFKSLQIATTIGELWQMNLIDFKPEG